MQQLHKAGRYWQTLTDGVIFVRPLRCVIASLHYLPCFVGAMFQLQWQPGLEEAVQYPNALANGPPMYMPLHCSYTCPRMPQIINSIFWSTVMCTCTLAKIHQEHVSHVDCSIHKSCSNVHEEAWLKFIKSNFGTDKSSSASLWQQYHLCADACSAFDHWKWWTACTHIRGGHRVVLRIVRVNKMQWLVSIEASCSVKLIPQWVRRNCGIRAYKLHYLYMKELLFYIVQ